MTLRKSIWITAVAGLLAACGGPLKYDALSSPKAPGANASITADVHEDQHQTNLEVDIDNLAPASRVDPESTLYVAWYRRDDKERWTRIAGLEYEEGSREGTLRSAVPETHFDLWVTTERDVEAVSPSPNVVFTQHVGG